jgi:hypothetical protein
MENSRVYLHHIIEMGIITMRLMKILVAVEVIVNFATFGFEDIKWRIRNTTKESFTVSISENDPRGKIDNLILGVPPEILYGVDRYGGRDIGAEKYYKPIFQDGYTPPPGKEPFVSFQNDKGEFQLAFFDEKYACLRSDTAYEIRDDEQRRKHDRLWTEESPKYNGYVRHWLTVGPYLIIYGYNYYRFPQRSVCILYIPDDNSWPKMAKEVQCEQYHYVPPSLSNPQIAKEVDYEQCDYVPPPHFKPMNYLNLPQKRHRWSGFSSCFGCDDCDF